MPPPESPRPPSNRDPSRVPLGYEAFAGDRQFATTLARGLALLRCFTPREPVLGNKALAERTGLPRATVSRLTYTLSILGYLRAGRPSRLLPTRLGARHHRLSGARHARAAPGRARPMTALAEACGGSVSMGIRDRLDIVIVETARSSATLDASDADVGLTLPIAGSAIGRAWLAGCDAATRDAVLNAVRVKARPTGRATRRGSTRRSPSTSDAASASWTARCWPTCRRSARRAAARPTASGSRSTARSRAGACRPRGCATRSGRRWSSSCARCAPRAGCADGRAAVDRPRLGHT
jgi:DNA-binding IclR family transcriptional regulator